MSITENISKLDGGLGLIQNVPKEILNKLKISNIDLTNVNNFVDVVIISGGNVDNISQFVDKLGGKYESLGYGFGIINIAISKIPELLLNSEIQYVELPLNLITSDSQSNSAACVNSVQSTFGLDGTGVLIGFVDSGIDYTHPAFINEDGTTRIEYIYDLSGNGKIYDKNMINQALKSPDPLSIVNVVDVTEHGTHVAGIACAGGKIPKEYYGVAPKSSIIMVKSTRGRFSLSTQMMRGLKFLIDKSKELKMPIAINLSLSSNDGAHNGSSLLEKYIETIAGIERATICIAAGNEGAAAHHVQGKLQQENIIDINIAEDEPAVLLNLYKSILPLITIELINPTGVSTKEITIEEGYNYDEGAIGLDRYIIYSTGPKPFDMAGEIIIGFSSNKKYLTSGRWRIIIRVKNNYSGTYDIWLPITEGLNVNTKFLNPSVFNTLGIPATVQNIISVGSYNYLTNTISTFSGRGQEASTCNIKPDIVAPGENIVAAVPDRRFDSKTGTSMATPHITGISALLMQWGLVKGNDQYLFGERLKYYLIQGAKRRRQDVIYPNSSWGYGEVCANSSLEIIESTINSLRNYRYNINNSSGVPSVKEKKREIYNSKDRVSTIIEVASEDVFNEILKIPSVTGLLIKVPFALVIFPPDKLGEIEALATKVVVFDIPPIYTLEAISPIEASGAPIFNNNPYLNLNGRGVIVGIVDTGIDYLNGEFIKEDNTSRVFRIWDQTLNPPEEVYGIKYGEEFTQEKINEAIALKANGGDPYTIVNSKDTNGHGTMVAGVIGGRGKNLEVKGAAPDCEFIVVKLAEASEVELRQSMISSKVPAYTFSSLYLGIRYIVNVANRYKKPVVIYAPIGCNLGAHDGTGLLENYIKGLSTQVGTVFVTSTGNEGDTATHTEGVFTKVGDIKDIEIKIGKTQTILPLQIWINKPNIVTLSVVSPSGEIIKDLISKLTKKTTIKFVYEGTEMTIDYQYPELTTGDTLISIKMKDLKEGIWKFRLECKKIVDGKYFAWIPQRKLLDNETVFLSPSERTTLTLPSTGEGLISVACYNQNNNATVGFSGRGYTRDNQIKPDIAAGGINATVTKPGGGTAVVSGTSVSGAVVTGCCALLLQWGIVDGNNENMYATTIKSYLISGAKERGGDRYPNNEWGFGMLDMEGAFEFIRGNFRGLSMKDSGFDEYYVNKLFIRKPKDI